MKVALVTCFPFPDFVIDDEEPLRQAFRRRGVDVAEVPWDAEVDWSTWDAALLRTPWDYQARPDAFLAWCERCSRATRLVHDAAIVRWNLDKRYLRELAGLDVPIAPSVWLDARSSVDRHALAALPGAGDLFAKPVVGANALLAARFPRTDAGLAALEAHVAGRDFIVQPYLASVENHGELSLIWVAGAGFTHGVRKVPAAGDFRVQEDHGATDHRWIPDDDAVTLAERAITAARTRLGDLVYARIDLLRTNEGYVLNELELVEPALFMRHHPDVGEHLAAAVLRTSS